MNLDGKSDEFRLGYEAGRIWASLSTTFAECVAGGCDASNRETIEVMAAEISWSVEFEAGAPGRLSFNATKLKNAPPKLRLV